MQTRLLVPTAADRSQEVPMLYVDPAAGSIVLQVALAAVLGGMLTVKRWWSTVRSTIESTVKRMRVR